MKAKRANNWEGPEPPAERHAAHVWTVALCASLCLALCCPRAALADEKQHKVRPGQTLSGIADRYGVTKWSVAGLNGIDPEALVKVGDVLLIPNRNVVYINPGQTMWSVARHHNLTVEQLAKLNKIKPDALLKPGQRLVLPGFKLGRGERESWGKPRHRGRVELYRIAHRERLTVTLVDSRGRVRGPAVNQMARFMRPRGSTRKAKRPSRRLLSVLAQISDHFGGRRIDVISAYRSEGGFTSAGSQHVAAAALDIRIQGVPNTVLRDYCRALSRVGCGYYPNSTFVHVDARDRSTYWVDVSRPGERPEYVDPNDFKPNKGTREHSIDGDAEEVAEDGSEPAGDKGATPQARQTTDDVAG